MVCSVVNAYPQNISVYDKSKFSFNFYGDKCIGANFILTELDQTDWETNSVRIAPKFAGYEGKLYYYNGEEISVEMGTRSPVDPKEKNIVWKARVFEEVNLDTGIYPTNRIATGTFKLKTFTEGTVQSPQVEGAKASTTIFWIDKNLQLTFPCWIWINGEQRGVKAYKSDEGRIRVVTALSEIPAEGTTYAISNIYNEEPVTLESNQTIISTNIGLSFPRYSDYRGLSLNTSVNTKFTIDTPYPQTSQPIYYLEHNGNYYGINFYDSKTGIVGLVTDLSELPFNDGDKYTIYSSFIDSPYFYICNEKPTEITNIELAQKGEIIHCHADITTVSSIKYQYWNIYEIDYDNSEILVDTSEKMYISDCEYIFRKAILGSKYKAELHVFNQSGNEIVATSDIYTVTNKYDYTNIDVTNVVTDNNGIKLNIYITRDILKAGGGIKILRLKLQENSIMEYTSKNIEYVDTIKFDSDKAKDDIIEFIDYEVANKTKYRYFITAYQPYSVDDALTNYATYETNVIETDFNTYSIYALQEIAYTRYDVETDKNIDYDYMFSERSFKVTDYLLPEIDISDKHSISYNLGRSTYIGYASKPSVASWETSYDTFTLTFQLGNTKVISNNGSSYLDIVNNNIAFYQKWKGIIEKAPPILIKDYKGNVWFGEITGFKADIDNTILNRPIIVNVDFVETYSLDKVRVIGG